MGEDTLRDVLEDRLKDILMELIGKGIYGIYPDNIILEYVRKVADEAFSACGISKREQDEEW